MLTRRPSDRRRSLRRRRRHGCRLEIGCAGLGHADVALDQAVLHLDRTAHRVNDAAEFDNASIAGAFDDAAVMGGDCRIDEVAAQALNRASVRSSSAPARRL